MKHVFVETNFVIEVTRPFPSPAAQQLLTRAQPGGDVQLYVPWVAVAEAKRTLDRIIREDLGFADSLRQFVVREFLNARISGTDKSAVEALSKRATQARKSALQAIVLTVEYLASFAVP